MAINPSALTTLTPVRNLNQLGPLSKSRLPEATRELADDQVQLSRPSTAEPAEVKAKPSSSWLKRTLLGAGFTATALAGGLAGGSLMLTAAVSPASAQTAHVQVAKKNAKTAPATLLRQQHTPTHLLTSRIGVSPSLHDLGKLGKTETDIRAEAKTGPNGQQMTHDIRIDRLSRAADGKVLYNSDEAEVGTLDFHDQATGNWKTRSVVQGAGHYGKYLSVSETTTRSTGGAEKTEVKLRTIDSRTGKVVNLSELVSGEDYEKMGNTIEAGLNNPAGQNYQQPDMESWDYHMNNGFSLREARDGSVILTVAIPSNAESDAGKVSEFSFSLPASALLLK